MAETGNMEDNFEEKEFEWKITQYLALASAANWKTSFQSPVFYFSNISFYLRLRPKSVDKPGFSLFRLWRTISHEYSVQYDFIVKNLNGNVEQLDSGVLKKGETAGALVYFKLPERQKCEETSLDVLSITCRLKHGRTNFHQTSVLDGSKSVELIRLGTLSENFKSLFVNKENCDVILQVKDKEFHAHKAVLIARSSVFAAMFRHDTSEKQTGIIKIPDCDPDSFDDFLEFLYCGKLKDISFRSAFHLFSTSDKYEIQELKGFCVEYMEQSLENDTLCDVVELADEYDDVKLLNAAQKFFNKNISTVVETAEWENLLKNNYRLANKLIKGMASKAKIED